MPTYNKLVRDRIPEIIHADGKTCDIRVLSQDEYVLELRRKLAEEAAEFGQDSNPGELADVLEVVYALAEAQGLSSSDLEAIRLRKQTERGSFRERLFLGSVSD